MSLSYDIQRIREAIRKENEPLAGSLKALTNEVHDIYEMLSDLQGRAISDKRFEALPLEEQLLTIHSALLVAAKKAGVSLPKP